MKKIDSEKLVCSSLQAQQLIQLGILPVCVFCYELEGDGPEAGSEATFCWQFAGEYMGQDDCLPAWTKEEIAILIGGNFPKPDMYSDQEWQRQLNMIHYPVYMPNKMKAFTNGAQAYAEWLIFLLNAKKVTAEDCNKRLEAFYAGECYNPKTDALKNIGNNE